MKYRPKIGWYFKAHEQSFETIEPGINLIGQVEEFSDVHRTNNLIGVPKNVTSVPSLPQRFLYLQSEINTHPNILNLVPTLFTKTPVNQ